MELAPGGETATGQVARKNGDARGAEVTTPEVLRLLGAGATGAILMALGERPLRTKELTERVPGYAARTVYRYANRLAELGVIERHEEPGVPSKVIHSLSEPCGRDLYTLVEAYANVSLGRLPSGGIGARDWGSLALIADLWESGLIDELNLGPRSPTELSRAPHSLSFHQVNRRAGLFAAAGFIEEVSEAPTRRSYALTDKARRAMALIAGIGRWRRHHVVPPGRPGLTSGEVGKLMRTVLPLVTLPEHSGKNFELRIMGRSREELVWAGIGPDGVVVSEPGPLPSVDGTMQGKVTAWVDSVLDGPQQDLEAEGNVSLLTECLHRLHLALWGERGRDSTAAPAEAVAGGSDGA